MTDTPRIEGIPDPRKSASLKNDDAIDAEKFKKMLKVEDSEEAQKQHKRRKPKKQEEEEEFDLKEQEQNIPKDASFKALFGDQKTKESIFDIKGAKKEATAVSSDGPLSSIPNLGKVKKGDSPSILHLEGLVLKKPKQKEIQTLSLEKITSSEEIQAKEPSLSLEKKELGQLSDTETAISIPLMPAVSTPITSPEKESEEERTKKIGSLHETEHLPQEHEEKEEEEPPVPTFTPTPTPELVTPPLLTTESPAYATLSSQMFEFFEKMIGLLMIEEQKGISITTIKLSMPGSVFNNCEIKLEHFDTAPHAFNIQLLGNPEAVDLFNANYQGLVNAMSQGKHSFQTTIRRPILLESYRHLIKRKGDHAGDHPSDQQAM